MLRECKEHGFFRGDKCPFCNARSKFLMSEQELDKLGRILAGCLRHFPEKYGLKIDKQGWVSLDDFLESVKTFERNLQWLRKHHIRGLIATDPKGRYELKGDFIRATYGHTVDVELDLPTQDIPSKLYYPATSEEVDILLETGLKPSDRKKVHLSISVEKAVEAGVRRCEKPHILEVDAKSMVENGFVIQRAGKTVFVTSEVPAKFLKKKEI
jgi:putative RNA 2'-phosphotransferase